MTALVVAAHPDDEILGCGGTIARLSNEGREVHIVILGEGHTSRYPSRDEADQGSIERLVDAARGAADELGAASVVVHGFPDNRFDDVNLLDIVKVIEGHVREVKPDEVFVHSGTDLNLDHQLAFRATLTAVRPLPDSPVRALFCFEVPSSTEWAFGRVGGQFRPSAFIDVTATAATKFAALGHYEGEMRDFPHPRSTEGIRALLTTRGAQVGVPAAEAFETIFRRI